MDNGGFVHELNNLRKSSSIENGDIKNNIELQEKDLPPTEYISLNIEPVMTEINEKQQLVKKPKVVTVIGSGDYGRAISGRLVKSGYDVFIGSRNPNRQEIKDLVAPTGAHLVAQEKSLTVSDIIIIAVGRDHYNKLPLNLLEGKLLIDVSNNTKVQKDPRVLSNAEYLQQLIPKARVVKSFNVLSAYSLENGGLQGSKEVYYASDDTDAKFTVSQMIRDMGFSPVDFGALSASKDIEEIPLRLMPSWKIPVTFIFCLFLFLWTLAFIEIQICGSLEMGNWHVFWKELFFKNFNRVIGILALWTLACCYLPGLIAAYLQLWRGTKYRRFPEWLHQWLKMRKQLGLLMLGIASIHGCISLGYMSPQEMGTVYQPPKVYEVEAIVGNTTEVQKITVYDSEFTWSGGLFLIFAALAMCLTIVLGITSLPSVTATLTWREFTFIQSKLGWVLLIFSSLHDLFLGYKFMFRTWACYGTIPIGPQYALYPSLICVLMKIPLLLPPINKRLMKIRNGHVRKSATKSESF